MTTAARLVLADCEDALQDLIEADVGPMWRRRWFALVALLRTVGHVLDKVDGPTDSRLAEAISRQYKLLKSSLPEPQIYWGFIDDERNIVIKEYKFRAYNAASGVGVSWLSMTNPKTGDVMTIKANRYHEAHVHLLIDGPFEGRREVDVAAEAIQWWKSYLDSIDAQR